MSIQFSSVRRAIIYIYVCVWPEKGTRVFSVEAVFKHTIRYAVEDGNQSIHKQTCSRAQGGGNPRVLL